MTESTSPTPDPAPSQWMAQARLGLFIHWGLYSAAGRHEWVMQREAMSERDYLRYFDHFDPDLFDPRSWARDARQAGMGYVVVTTKHHDGFCLWDTQLSDFKAPNTPAGRDLLRPLIEAFREEELRVGLYHSLIDWHHPHFPVDGLHPQAGDPQFVAASGGRDISIYRDYLHAQVEELLTGYGLIDYLFFDFSYRDLTWGGKGAQDWGSAELNDRVRALQPQILINDRLDLDASADVVTPEQYQPVFSPGAKLWEACQTLNGSWGYDRDNTDWKSPELLIRMLVDGVSKGGNLLLNVGPDGRGRLQPEARSTLQAIGEWMALHSRSVVGAGPSEFEAPSDVRFTQRGHRLYAHLMSWPFDHLHLDGLVERVEYAQFLHDGSEITIESIAPDQIAQNMVMASPGHDVLTLRLPTRRPQVGLPVIELFLR